MTEGMDVFERIVVESITSENVRILKKMEEFLLNLCNKESVFKFVIDYITLSVNDKVFSISDVMYNSYDEEGNIDLCNLIKFGEFKDALANISVGDKVIFEDRYFVYFRYESFGSKFWYDDLEDKLFGDLVEYKCIEFYDDISNGYCQFYYKNGEFVNVEENKKLSDLKSDAVYYGHYLLSGACDLKEKFDENAIKKIKEKGEMIADFLKDCEFRQEVFSFEGQDEEMEFSLYGDPIINANQIEGFLKLLQEYFDILESIDVYCGCEAYFVSDKKDDFSGFYIHPDPLSAVNKVECDIFKF